MALRNTAYNTDSHQELLARLAELLPYLKLSRAGEQDPSIRREWHVVHTALLLREDYRKATKGACWKCHGEVVTKCEGCGTQPKYH